MVNPFILLPLYIYPASNAWNTLYDSINANPSVQFQVIVNPASGPGDTPFPDENYIANIAQLNSYPNVATLGYVHTLYGARDPASVQADVQSYQDWSTYGGSDIHMDGIFFDESPSDSGMYSYVQGIISAAKSTMTNGNTVILNPGVNVPTNYYDIADYILAFENGYPQWTRKGPSSIPSGVRAQSIVMIHHYSNTVTRLATDVQNIIDAGIAGQFITTQADYDAWSTQWSSYVSYIAQSGAAKFKFKRMSRFFQRLVQ